VERPCELRLYATGAPSCTQGDTPDPECDLDYVPNKARQADVAVAVSNSSGFGGHNTSIVLRRLEG